MFEAMSYPVSHDQPTYPLGDDKLVPVAVPVSAVPVARPAGFPTISPGAAGETYITTTQPITDRMAVASAVCGLTGFIPVFSQVAAIALGLLSLRRIRRAQRQGVAVPGRGWAMTGIVGGSITLIGWIAVGGILAMVGGSLSQSTEALDLLGNLSQHAL